MPQFEEQLKALEAVVDKLEHGDLPLEESLKLFEEGITLSESCKKELDAAEGRVQVLTARQNGNREAVDLELES